MSGGPYLCKGGISFCEHPRVTLVDNRCAPLYWRGAVHGVTAVVDEAGGGERGTHRHPCCAAVGPGAGLSGARGL